MKHLSWMAALAVLAAVPVRAAETGMEVDLETAQGARAAFVHTDAQGNFAFANILWGMYIVNVQAGGVDIGNGIVVGDRKVHVECRNGSCRSGLIELRGAVSGHIERRN